MIVAVSSSLNPVEAKRAILGRRWLLLDRWVRPSLLVRLRTLHTLVCDLRLKAHAENAIPDQLYEKRFDRWPVDTPSTKEAYYMRDIFDGELAQYANSFRYPVCQLKTFLAQACSCPTPQRKQPFGMHRTFRRISQCLGLANTRYRWIPRGDWGCAADPSGRSVSIHNAAYE